MSQSLNDINLNLEDLYEVNVEPSEENKTEQAYLEMADQFKELMDKKSRLVKDLKKAIIVLYGLIRTADENQDPEMMHQARQAASEYLDEFFFPDDD